MRPLARMAAGMLSLALLAGCAGRAMDPPDTPRGRCQREALRDPDVRAATQQTEDAFPTIRAEALKVQQRVTREVINRCLSQSGLGEPGGVQPVQR